MSEARVEIRERVKRMEGDLARLLDGWGTPGSGSKGQKGDGQSSMFLAEAKYSSQVDGETPVIPVQLDWLETLVTHALTARKVPLLALEWVDGQRRILVPTGYYYSETLGGESEAEQVILANRVIPLTVPAATLRLYFLGMRTNNPEWIALSWYEFLGLRREVQPKRASRLGGAGKKDGGLGKPRSWGQSPGGGQKSGFAGGRGLRGGGWSKRREEKG